MAKRSQSFRRYASGGNPRFSTLDAGLTAMKQQSDTKIRQLEKLSGQQERADNIFLDSLKGKLSREADNRKEKYEIEVIGPRKMKADALEKNNERLQQGFKQKIKEKEDLAAVWGELAPSIAKGGQELYEAGRGVLDRRAASDDFNKLVNSGKLTDYYKFYEKLEEKGKQEFSKATDLYTERVAHYIKTGDFKAKQEADVILHQLKTRNPKLRAKLVADVTANIEGITRDLVTYLDENIESVNHTNIASHIQFRGLELLQQLNIRPKSKEGLQIQEAFRKQAIKYEEQYTFAYDYNKDSQTINEQPALISASHKENDYISANNSWKIMVSSYSKLPQEDRAGNWSAPVGVNMKDSFKDLAVEMMYNPRYANNWTLFSEEILGKNAANEFGYVIVNPQGDPNKKHNRILGRHPNLENELLIEWGKIYDSVKKTEQKKIESKQAADAQPFIEKVTSGFYRKPENQGQLWRDFKQYQNNPVALATIGRSLGFSDTSLNHTLLHDTLFRALRSGDTEAIVSAWMSAPEENQEINFAYESLGELAEVLHQPINKLDNKLIKIAEAKITTLIKDNKLTQSRHDSVEGMDKEIASFLATYFIQNRRNYDTADQTYSAAVAELNSMMGINADGTLQPPDNKTRVRGFGQFAHRVGTTGNNQVVFLSKIGTVYNNTSSGEIQGMLDGDMKAFDSRASKINYLVNAVANEAEDHFTDEALLEVFSTSGHAPNHPILEQIYPHLKKLNLTKKEFLDRVGFARSGTEGNELFCEMTGDDWCDTTNGTLHIKNPNDKLMKAAFGKFREQLGLEPWEAAMLGSSNLKVRDYIINKLDKEQPDE